MQRETLDDETQRPIDISGNNAENGTSDEVLPSKRICNFNEIQMKKKKIWKKQETTWKTDVNQQFWLNFIGSKTHRFHEGIFVFEFNPLTERKNCWYSIKTRMLFLELVKTTNSWTLQR